MKHAVSSALKDHVHNRTIPLEQLLVVDRKVFDHHREALTLPDVWFVPVVAALEYATVPKQILRYSSSVQLHEHCLQIQSSTAERIPTYP